MDLSAMKIASLYHFLFLPFSLFSQSLSTRKSFSSFNTLAVHLSPSLFFLYPSENKVTGKASILTSFLFYPSLPSHSFYLSLSLSVSPVLDRFNSFRAKMPPPPPLAPPPLALPHQRPWAPERSCRWPGQTNRRRPITQQRPTLKA